MNIELLKLETLKDAPIPQEGKYPSGTVLATGHMWDYSRPDVGEVFFIYSDKKTPFFKTSLVEEILEDTKEHIKFRTLNSVYKIIIKQ